MSKELYNDKIIEWAGKSGLQRKLTDVDCTATSSNPLCGDRVTIEIKMSGDVVEAACCTVKGCVLCKASGSILSEHIQGMDLEGLNELALKMETVLSAPDDTFPGEFYIFQHAGPYKSRHSCIMLPLKTAAAAVLNYKNPNKAAGGK